MIQRAKLTEIEEIMELTRACASEMCALGIFQWNEVYPSKEAFQNDIARNELFVLKNETRIMGCIVISTFKDEEYVPIKWLTPDGDNYYIHRLGVHPDFQKQGNAKKLMDFAETYIKENKGSSVRLDTFSENERNQKFYLVRGYKKTGEIFFPKQSQSPFYCFELVLN